MTEQYDDNTAAGEQAPDATDATEAQDTGTENASESGTAAYDPRPSGQILKDPTAGTDEDVNAEKREPGDYGTTDQPTDEPAPVAPDPEASE